jgi:hypothetical protein
MCRSIENKALSFQLCKRSNVFNFAYNPKAKIEVLMNLAIHLQKINQMITNAYSFEDKEKSRLSAEKIEM